jgi:DNA-directed RNA polymerase specialized sigma24 family protein
MATRLKAQAARRRWLMTRLEGFVAPAESESDAEREELRLALQAELDRLPDPYRRLVVHYYLEGRSNQEVARLLGCPVGTVKGQLFRARSLLRQRLRDRGGVHTDDLVRHTEAIWGEASDVPAPGRSCTDRRELGGVCR